MLWCGRMTAAAPGFRQYWTFFWPLAINGMFILLGQQAFNGVLARHPDPERELAVFACALGVFYFFDVGTAFMPNLVTVYARSTAARVRVLRFCLVIGAAFTIPVWWFGATDAGRAALGLMFRMDRGMLDDVAAYLRVLSALSLLHVMHHYLNGMLILAGRTFVVSLIGIAGVLISMAIAFWGFSRGWPSVWVVGGAEWLSGLFKLGCLAVAWRGARGEVVESEVPRPGYRELAHFFWPVCISGMTFGISRPLLFIFIARVPGSVAIMAAMRVSFDFLMLFQTVTNQFRHFFAAFGVDDLPGKRRFMAVITVALVGMMGVLLLIPPLSEFIFLTALGLNARLYDIARFMCAVLLVVPIILMIRNYYHGILIARKRTAAMASGSAARVLAIMGSAALLLMFGMLDERTAVLGMIAGFSAEMLIALVAVRRLRRCWD
jgi:Progressive ankylosis protein (ANKH)